MLYSELRLPEASMGLEGGTVACTTIPRRLQGTEEAEMQDEVEMPWQKEMHRDWRGDWKGVAEPGLRVAVVGLRCGSPGR